jgi:hypothetical protein
MDKGYAWHFEIPDEALLFWVSNNLLEYIASIISPRVDMLASHLNTGDCFILMTDRSTSASCLRKTNFWEIIGKDADPVQSKACIKTA